MRLDEYKRALRTHYCHRVEDLAKKVVAMLAEECACVFDAREVLRVAEELLELTRLSPNKASG